MKPYVKVYMNHFGYGEQDFIPSELSGKRAHDIHHIKFRSQGGKDEIENLIALTREEHNEAHANPVCNKKLKEKHLIYLDLF